MHALLALPLVILLSGACDSNDDLSVSATAGQPCATNDDCDPSSLCVLHSVPGSLPPGLHPSDVTCPASDPLCNEIQGGAGGSDVFGGPEIAGGSGGESGSSGEGGAAGDTQGGSSGQAGESGQGGAEVLPPRGVCQSIVGGGVDPGSERLAHERSGS